MPGNAFGQAFTFTTWGESHGPALGCVIDGVPPQIPLSEADLQGWLDARKPGQSRYTTQRRESDTVRILSGVFEDERTNGQDGFVSIEVAPDLAHNTDATISEARRLWQAVDRPNLMVKVPGTKAGIPAVEQLLREGLNINVTLLFSIENHERVMWSYIKALEERQSQGQPIDRIASVASFFVSRVDTLVDSLLDEKIAQANGDAAHQERLQSLRSGGGAS